MKKENLKTSAEHDYVLYVGKFILKVYLKKIGSSVKVATNGLIQNVIHMPV